MSDTPPSRSSSSGEVDNSYDSSLEDLRVAFLGVKFSHKDAANLEKRMKNAGVDGKLSGRPVVSMKKSMTASEFTTAVSDSLPGLSPTSSKRLTALAQEPETLSPLRETALEEVSEGARLFGFVGGVRKASSTKEEREARFDLALVGFHTDYEAAADMGLCACCMSRARKKLKQDYLEAIVLSYLRVKAVEQLRIEGLTTRGQHHRKERFRSRSVTAPEEE